MIQCWLLCVVPCHARRSRGRKRLRDILMTVSHQQSLQHISCYLPLVITATRHSVESIDARAAHELQATGCHGPIQRSAWSVFARGKGRLLKHSYTKANNSTDRLSLLLLLWCPLFRLDPATFAVEPRTTLLTACASDRCDWCCTASKHAQLAAHLYSPQASVLAASKPAYDRVNSRLTHNLSH